MEVMHVRCAGLTYTRTQSSLAYVACPSPHIERSVVSVPSRATCSLWPTGSSRTAATDPGIVVSRRARARIGAKKAILAVAASMLTAAYSAMTFPATTSDTSTSTVSVRRTAPDGGRTRETRG